MKNVHGAEVEQLLRAKQVMIEPIHREHWRLSLHAGRSVTYNPSTGNCTHIDDNGNRVVKELRGSPARVVEIIEGYIA